MWSAIIFTLKTVSLKKPSRIGNVKPALWRRLIQISAGAIGYHGGFLDFLSPSMQMPRKLTWLTTKAFFKTPIRHSPTTLSVYTVQRLVDTVIKHSVSKHLFWPNSNSGSLVSWLMNLHYFRKFILTADVTTGSQSVWIWMRYQGTLHIHPFKLLISYKHIQRIPAFVKKFYYSLLDRT